MLCLKKGHQLCYKMIIIRVVFSKSCAFLETLAWVVLPVLARSEEMRGGT